MPGWLASLNEAIYIIPFSFVNLAKKGAPTVGKQVAKLITKGVGANTLSDTTSKVIHKSEKKNTKQNK
jgi:hypothetical protein